MRMNLKRLLSTLVLFSLILPAFAQEVSKKQDLTLLPLSVYGPKLDRRVTSSVDSRIKEVFVNLGRFTVLGLSTRLDTIDTESFLDKIREMKRMNVTIPDDVKFGNVAFTEKDYNALVGSFIVVIPQITNFAVERDDGKYKAIVETSFTFLRGSDLSAIKVANISTSSTEDRESEAVSNAVGAIPMQLTFEIRKIPEFQLKTGVIDVKGADVMLELGRNLGITLGDEYVLQSKSTVAGFERVQETGLIIIKEVQEKYSVGQLIYGDPIIGDPLAELPRFGLDIEGYVQGGTRKLLSPLAGYLNNDSFLAVAGVKGVLSRGAFDLRPSVALEIPFEGFGVLGILFVPFNAWAGLDYMIYMGRLNLQFSGALGYSGLYDALDLFDLEDQFLTTHIGGKVEATAGLLLGRDWKIQGTAGFRAMVSFNELLAIWEPFFGSYASGYFGASIVMKY